MAFAGRADTQVKIRGFRIPRWGDRGPDRPPAGGPGVEVVLATEGEAARPAAGGVRRAATRAPRWPASRAALTTCARRCRPFNARGRRHLLPSLPLTPNGKVDRQALHRLARAPVETAMHYVAPHGQLEATIAEILHCVLKVEQVGVEDNFFEARRQLAAVGPRPRSRLQAALDREDPGVRAVQQTRRCADPRQVPRAGLEAPPTADDGTAAQLPGGQGPLAPPAGQKRSSSPWPHHGWSGGDVGGRIDRARAARR